MDPQPFVFELKVVLDRYERSYRLNPSVVMSRGPTSQDYQAYHTVCDTYRKSWKGLIQPVCLPPDFPKVLSVDKGLYRPTTLPAEIELEEKLWLFATVCLTGGFCRFCCLAQLLRVAI